MDDKPITPATPAEVPASPAPETPQEDKPIEPVTRVPVEPATPESKEEEEGAEGEGMTPSDKKVVSTIITKQLDPVQKRLEEQSNLIETTNFIAANPDYSKYRESIIKHMNHPAYRNIPVDRIAKMVAGDDLIKIGAQREREAAQKAASTKAGGSSARIQPSGKDWLTASKDDFEAQKAAVLGRQGQ